MSQLSVVCRPRLQPALDRGAALESNLRRGVEAVPGLGLVAVLPRVGAQRIHLPDLGRLQVEEAADLLAAAVGKASVDAAT